jgi:nucleoside-diphosphate-sugar epimerase
LKVFITGGTGFTGSHLAQNLLEQGEEVRLLVRSKEKAGDLEKRGAEVVLGDIADQDTIIEVTKNIDIIFNIAAAFREANLPDKRYWEVNFNGTKNIIKACMKNSVSRLVHCSTIGVVSSVKKPLTDETAPYSPGDIYQKSKCMAEKEVIKYARNGNISASIIRPCAIYGPGDLRLLKMFKRIAEKRFYIIGNGKAFYHMVYIDDLISAFILAAKKDEALGEVFIIGGERYTTLNELFSIIAKEFKAKLPRFHIPYKLVEILATLAEFAYKPTGKEPPLYRRRVYFFKKNRAFDISKAKKYLGYKPRFSLEKGIHLTKEWYIDNGYIKGID